jgi:hypothetical protein
MDSVVDDRSPRVPRPLKPGMKMRKVYLGCVMVRQLDGTVKVWAPVYGEKLARWDLIRVSSSMKSAHNFVHNTRAKKG